MITHLLAYRRYIWQTAWNELRYRYAGTGLGVFWNLANPILEVLIYTLVFTQVIVVPAKEGQSAPFVLYLCVGLLPWLAFAETLIQGSNALLENTNYLKHLAIPAEIFVAKNVLTITFSLYISLLLLILFSLYLGEPLSWSWLLLPAIILLLQALGLSLALILASLRVFFRDIGAPIGSLEITNPYNLLLHSKTTLQHRMKAPAHASAGSLVRFRQSVQLNLAPGEYVFSLGLLALHPDEYARLAELSQEQLNQKTVWACRVA